MQKRRKVICPECNYKWSISKKSSRILWWFPLAKATSPLFVCKNCGSEGRRMNRFEAKVNEVK